MNASQNEAQREVDERWSALHDLDQWLDVPMMLLSFIWLMLVVVELVWGATHVLEVFGTAIWVAFLVEFVIRLALAPEKFSFLKRNWLTVLALVAPAFRLLRAFRFLRYARAARGLRLVRIVGTANRGMNALRKPLNCLKSADGGHIRSAPEARPAVFGRTYGMFRNAPWWLLLSLFVSCAHYSAFAQSRCPVDEAAELAKSIEQHWINFDFWLDGDDFSALSEARLALLEGTRAHALLLNVLCNQEPGTAETRRLLAKRIAWSNKMITMLEGRQTEPRTWDPDR